MSSIALSDAMAVYKKDLETLKTALESRKSNLFQVVCLKEPLHEAEEIQKHVDAINALISTSNNKTSTLENDKILARDALRLTDVHMFFETKGYDGEFVRIANLKTDFDTANTIYSNAEKVIREAEAEMRLTRPNTMLFLKVLASQNGYPNKSL
ncbi:AAA domain protein [compost metagenome]